MPLYEYKCASCGKTFEVIQKFADEPLKVHPECGGEVARLFSAPAFHLKGTGWYATDYAKKSNGSDAKANPESDPKSDPKKTEATKSDSKGSDSKSSADSSSSSSTETKPASSSDTKPSTPAAPTA